MRATIIEENIQTRVFYHPFHWQGEGRLSGNPPFLVQSSTCLLTK